MGRAADSAPVSAAASSRNRRRNRHGHAKKVDLKELVREREGEMRGESERGKLLACVAFVLLVR